MSQEKRQALRTLLLADPTKLSNSLSEYLKIEAAEKEEIRYKKDEEISEIKKEFEA